MTSLDFIAHDSLREALQADWQELQKCTESRAWKAVMVLSGSIVEAIMVDALVPTNFSKRTGKNPLKLTLAELVEAARDEEIISARAADLSSVIRSYRNLIHPGRQVRLKERVDEQSARIAQTLVELISREVADGRAKRYGLTAEQLLTKIERDSSVNAIFPHLVEDLSDHDREKLLLRLIPSRYRERKVAKLEDMDLDFENYAVLSRLADCFRLLVDGGTADIRRKVVQSFVVLVREGDDDAIREYAKTFFRARDLAHVEASQLPLLKDYVLHELKSGPNDVTLTFAQGIERFLKPADVQRWLEPFLRLIVSDSTSDDRKQDLTKYVDRGYRAMSEDMQQVVIQHLTKVVRAFTSRDDDTKAARVTDLTEYLELPF